MILSLFEEVTTCRAGNQSFYLSVHEYDATIFFFYFSGSPPGENLQNRCADATNLCSAFI